MYGMGCSLVLTGEVKAWLDGLDDAAFGRVACYLDLLAERGSRLCPPHSRRLGRNCRLRELLVPRSQRRAYSLTYWLDGNGTVLMLTVRRWWRPRGWESRRARAALRQRRHHGPRQHGSRRDGGARRPSGEEPA
jgi:hypothetical protein